MPVDGVVALLGGLPLIAWLSAGLAGLAAYGLVRAPSDRLRRAAGAGPDGDRRGGRRPDPPGWLRGRPDGPGLRQRLVLGAVAATGLCVAGSGLAVGPGRWVWVGWPLLAGLVTVVLGSLEPGSARVRRERLVADAPRALDLLAAGLAAGLPVRLAGRAVVAAFGDAPVGEDLARVLALADLGVAESDAWRSLAGHPQLGPAAQDLSRSVESGTLMVEALARHAEVAREARRSAAVVRARSVGVRSVLPLMVCFIPAFLLLGVVPTVVSALTAALG